MKAQALLLGILTLTSAAPGATLVVDLNGGADYTDIQSAIDAAADGDTVLVKPGEYVITEPIDFNRLHDPNDLPSPPVKNIVVRSEGGAEVTTIRMSETPKDSDRASVVLFQSAEGPESILEGFTVTGGKGTKWGSGWSQRGGGGVILAGGSSPTLRNITIIENEAAEEPGGHSDGGGLCCVEGSSPTLEHCTISNNTAYGDGGGCAVWTDPRRASVDAPSARTSLGPGAACIARPARHSRVAGSPRTVCGEGAGRRRLWEGCSAPRGRQRL